MTNSINTTVVLNDNSFSNELMQSFPNTRIKNLYMFLLENSTDDAIEFVNIVAHLFDKEIECNGILTAVLYGRNSQFESLLSREYSNIVYSGATTNERVRQHRGGLCS